MAHFAQIDENNKVTKIIVINNIYENIGSYFIANTLQLPGTWIQTSFNGNIRKRFAEVGGSYDPDNDVFIGRKPFSSWVINTDTFEWEPPVARPEGGDYKWNEEEQNWDLVE